MKRSPSQFGRKLERVSAREVPQPFGARLERALLGVAIDRDEAELRPVAEHPFVVVEHRPVAVSAHLDTVLDASSGTG